MMRPEAKSLSLHRAVQRKIAASADPMAWVEKALDWARPGAMARPEDVWLVEWVDLLTVILNGERSLNDLYDLMLSGEQHAIDMRQSTPFSVVLTVPERTRALLSFEDAWRDRRSA
ncbi:hypothetical protein JKG47_07125 [Acidithiobacillus sp. MC6.1]|nr:hypothetical protein [Acidithiobacillus sp. MC6.1]